MAELSGEVDNILREFQQEFSKVKTETGTIGEINSQTIVVIDFNILLDVSSRCPNAVIILSDDSSVSVLTDR